MSTYVRVKMNKMVDIEGYSIKQIEKIKKLALKLEQEEVTSVSVTPREYKLLEIFAINVMEVEPQDEEGNFITGKSRVLIYFGDVNVAWVSYEVTKQLGKINLEFIDSGGQ